MDLQIESTTLWDFPTQNYGDIPHGNNKYNGVTPALVIWNLLQRYTKEGDLVVDPMCGSGTTIDVAKELKRKYIRVYTSTSPTEEAVNSIYERIGFKVFRTKPFKGTPYTIKYMELDLTKPNPELSKIESLG